MTKKKLNRSRPPLSFLGSKLRWWRELESLARSLPHGACVFDAFGGSMSAARVIKDARPDLTVITNDFEHAYRDRLDLAPETAKILNKLQAIVPRRKSNSFERIDPTLQEQAVALVKSAKDSQTAWRWLNQPFGIRNNIPFTAAIDVERCRHWTDGLIVIDQRLDAREARYFVNSGAFIILDPPYLGKNQASYSKGLNDAQDFARAVIESGAKWCLFERPNSPLVELAMPLATEVIKPLRNRSEKRTGRGRYKKIHEIMLVRQRTQAEAEEAA